METQEYIKLKPLVDELIKSITESSIEKGIDVASSKFAMDLEMAISNFLKQQGYTYKEYLEQKVKDGYISNAMEKGEIIKTAEMVQFLAESQDAIQEVKQTSEEAKEVIRQTIRKAKEVVDTLNKEPVSWDRVEKKPKVHSSDEIQQMIDDSIYSIPQGKSDDEIISEASVKALEETKKLIPDIEQIGEQLPMVGERVRDSLELLEGDERLDKSAIKGLEDYEEVKKNAKSKQIFGGVGAIKEITGGTGITVDNTIPGYPVINQTSTTDGDVHGPSSATDNNVAVFDGITGKIIKDGGANLASKLNVSAKATGAEINTGTDNDKYVTSKAIADSTIVKGPASAVADNFATYNTTTGKLIKDSGVSINKLSLNPTLYSSSVDSKGGVYNGDFEVGTGSQSNTSGWIGAEQYGWFLLERIVGGSATASYDNTVSRKGTQSMKLDVNLSGSQTYRLTNLPGVDGSESYTPLTTDKQKYLFPAKPSTTYKVTIYAKTQITSATAGFTFNVREHSASLGNVLASQAFTAITTTQDFTQSQKVFTTNASTAYFSVDLSVATTVGTIWIDSIQIQEVSSLTPTNTIPETMGGIFQAQNTTAVDQSQTSANQTRGFGNPTRNTIAQQFTPTKIKGYSFSFKRVASVGTFTGDVTISIQSDSGSDTPSGTILASKKYLNAEWEALSTSVATDIIFPYLRTSGSKYWAVFSSSTVDASNYPVLATNSGASSYSGGLLKGYVPTTWTVIDDDLLFYDNYSKLSEGMTLVSNGIRTNLMASSKDGLLGGSTLNLDNGKWRYDSSFFDNTELTNGILFASNAYQATLGDRAVLPRMINGWFLNSATGKNFQSSNSATERYITFKINTILPIKHLSINWAVNCFGGGEANVKISSDGVSFATIQSNTTSGATPTNPTYETDSFNGKTTFYIQAYKSSSVSDYLQVGRLQINADIDTSSIPLPTIYPLAINQFSDSIKLATAPSRAYFRLNKYVNENNVMMSAIELTDASANPLGYVCVEQDNSQETSPVCNILSTSTGYQQSGTGSSVAGGYLLNDGEYMTLTGTNYNFEIDYQLGTGTTTISAITKNIAYLSSNSSLADATLDASLMANFFLSVRQQGLSSAIGDVRNDIQDVRDGLITRPSELTNNAVITGGGGKKIKVTGILIDDSNNITLPAGQTVKTTSITSATYDLLSTDYILSCDYTATGAITSLTLPTAQMVNGRIITVKDTGGLAGTNSITIDTEGSEKIDGADTYVINTNYDSVTIYSNGVGWFVI